MPQYSWHWPVCIVVIKGERRMEVMLPGIRSDLMVNEGMEKVWMTSREVK